MKMGKMMANKRIGKRMMTSIKPKQSEFEGMAADKSKADPAAEARRAEARERLEQALKDPAFRAIEGFPIGTDEAILALSDPPYYTACPNPFLPEIITEWQAERARLREELGLQDETYQRDPFATDVSEGKNDPIYNAHSYHTKVPHKAIMRYILHYTDPGDIVFDGFCGTGMTGVAAQLCGDRAAVQALGYRVDEQGMVWDGEKAISRLGARKAVLNDLSPAATFIGYNYNTPVDAAAFEREARRILDEVERECGWMYETWHPHCDDPNRVKAKINYRVLSEVFACPVCDFENVFWDSMVDKNEDELSRSWSCQNCQATLSKNPSKKTNSSRAVHAFEYVYDWVTNSTIQRVKLVPVVIYYSIGKKKFEKKPDREDLFLFQKIDEYRPKYEIPNIEMLFKSGIWGDQWRAGAHEGITHFHHFFTKSGLIVATTLYHHAKAITDRRISHAILYWIQSILFSFTRLNRFLKNAFSQVNRQRSGTLYIPSLVSDVSASYALSGKIDRHSKIFTKLNVNPNNAAIGCGSSTDFRLIRENSIDYIFVDPPFGSNLMYSELNFLWEGWLKVYTKNSPEAVISEIQKKGLQEYQDLMARCFSEFYRILIPGHWITIEFHNSLNTVWNAIQEGLLNAGFVVADVRTFDKQQGTFNQVNSSASVKQDLIISAYKPNGQLEENFRLTVGTEESVWEFIRYHLSKLPVVNWREAHLVVNPERQAYLLFDRMVAFHIQHGVMLPISAPEFYAGLEQRFIPRDGMYFLPEQVAEYDRAKLEAEGVVQIPLLVTDEKTAIAWLRQQLDPQAGGPQTAAELNPKFKMALYQAKHELAPELSDLLQQNFLQDEEGRWYIPNPNRAEDLEKVRQRALLREFGEYVKGQGRLRQFRTEAVRAGFLDCLNRQDYATLLKVAKRLPEEVLRSDPDLLMYFDSALLRSENG